MPDQNGVLTQSDKEKITSHLQKTWKNACPMCGGRNWDVADHLINPTALIPGIGLAVGGPSYPMALVISECGFVAPLAAGPLGILPQTA